MPRIECTLLFKKGASPKLPRFFFCKLGNCPKTETRQRFMRHTDWDFHHSYLTDGEIYSYAKLLLTGCLVAVLRWYFPSKRITKTDQEALGLTLSQKRTRSWTRLMICENLLCLSWIISQLFFLLFVLCLFVCLFVCLLVGWLVGWLMMTMTIAIT